MAEIDATDSLLKSKYSLHNSSEVEAAARKTKRITGQWPAGDALSRIDNYLQRFHLIIDRTDRAKREHGIRAFKTLLYDRYVTKPNEIPEGYWENQLRIIRERGQAGDLDAGDLNRLKREQSRVLISDQKSSLDNWIDYLASADAPYPDALKYWALRSALSMNNYDKEKKAFSQRSRGTVKPFPELNREALSYVMDLMVKKYRGESLNSNNVSPDELSKMNYSTLRFAAGGVSVKS